MENMGIVQARTPESVKENATLCVWDIHEFILTIRVEGMIYDIFREITIYT